MSPLNQTNVFSQKLCLWFSRNYIQLVSFNLTNFSRARQGGLHCQTAVASLITIGHINIGSNTKESHFHTDILFMNNSTFGIYSFSSASPVHSLVIFFSFVQVQAL